MTDRVRRRPGRPAGRQHVIDSERVLDAAERAIRRDGAGVSIEAIAHEAGVTKPIVYARVGNRAELADALAQRLADRLIEAAVMAIGKRRTGRTRLVALIRSNLETLAEHREVFLFVSGGASEDMPQRTLYLAKQSAAPLAERLAAGRMAEGLDPSVAVAWSYAIVGLLNMVSLWWITESDQSAERVAEQLAELLWSGLAGGDQTAQPMRTVTTGFTTRSRRGARRSDPSGG